MLEVSRSHSMRDKSTDLKVYTLQILQELTEITIKSWYSLHSNSLNYPVNQEIQKVHSHLRSVIMTLSFLWLITMKIASLIVKPSFSPLHSMSSNGMSKNDCKMSAMHLTLKVGVNVLKLDKSNQIIGMQVLTVVHVNMCFPMSPIQSVSRPVKVPMTTHLLSLQKENFILNITVLKMWTELCKKNLAVIMTYLWNNYFLLLVWDRYVPRIITTAKQLEIQNYSKTTRCILLSNGNH